MSKTVNPSAFPVHMNCPRHGMTLRDYFAAKVSHQMLYGLKIPDGADPTEFFAQIAGYSYQMADAMLAERAK